MAKASGHKATETGDLKVEQRASMPGRLRQK